MLSLSGFKPRPDSEERDCGIHYIIPYLYNMEVQALIVLPIDAAILANRLYDIYCGSTVTTSGCFQIRPKYAEFKGICREINNLGDRSFDDTTGPRESDSEDEEGHRGHILSLSVYVCFQQSPIVPYDAPLFVTTSRPIPISKGNSL